MVDIIPFAGVVYNPNKIEDINSVFSPPYDVISPEEQSELYRRSKYNVVRLILSVGTSDEKYTQAGETFRRWLGEEILIQDREPALYPYYQEFEDCGRRLVRKGFIAAVRLEDFSSGKIVPHERTFPEPKEDRLKLTSACEANLSSVFSIYFDKDGVIEETINKSLTEKPFIDALLDGVRHKMWRLYDLDTISQIKRYMKDKTLLIADGHHRYETALNYRDTKRKELGVKSSDKPHDYEYVMMCLVRGESEGLVIKPTHRLVRGITQFQPEEFLRRLEARFSIGKAQLEDEREGFNPNEFGVVLSSPECIFKVTPKVELRVQFENLGVMSLHSQVFGEILEEDKLEISYTKSTEEVLSLVKSGKFQIGFILSPPNVSDIMELAIRSKKMPHKSTYFYPKILSGVVFRLLR